jgi:hypothetical protein
LYFELDFKRDRTTLVLRRTMATPENITPETVAQMAAQSLGMSITPADASATAELLNALSRDMKPFRQMPLGDDEPATTYAVEEGNP